MISASPRPVGTARARPFLRVDHHRAMEPLAKSVLRTAVSPRFAANANSTVPRSHTLVDSIAAPRRLSENASVRLVGEVTSHSPPHPPGPAVHHQLDSGARSRVKTGFDFRALRAQEVANLPSLVHAALSLQSNKRGHFLQRPPDHLRCSTNRTRSIVSGGTRGSPGASSRRWAETLAVPQRVARQACLAGEVTDSIRSMRRHADVSALG
jgi:hypothetical protein